MIDFSVTFDAEPLQRALRAAPATVFAGIKDGGMRGLYGFRKEFLARVPSHLSRARKGVANPSTWPVRSTGNDIATLAWSISTGSIAAFYLQVGGTIRPRRKKFIALALAAAKNKSDTARLPGYSSPTSARRLRGAVFVFHEQNGEAVLLEVRRTVGRSRQIVPTFQLVTSITVKPVLGFFESWENGASEGFVRRLGLTLNRELRKAGLPPTGLAEEVGA